MENETARRFQPFIQPSLATGAAPRSGDQRRMREKKNKKKGNT